MKSGFVCLIAIFALTVSGCESPKDNALATDGASADDIAKYEQELAGVSGDESYDDAGDDDATE